jgi:DNA polymerase family B
VFAAWKLIAEEIKHPNFSYLPAVVSSVLSKRIPHHDNLRLTQWYSNDSGKDRWRVLHHRIKEAIACLQLFDVLDIIGRSGEAARLSGVEFSQSFPGIRGSQYKVEGVLLRALQSLNSNERGSRKGKQQRMLTMTKEARTQNLTIDRKSQVDSPWKAVRLASDDDDPVHTLTGRGYFFFSPSFRDVNRQEALEVQALTLEPVSGHRLDPVVVCDFTALYPSLIIAYNLCYSTCAGRLEYHSTRSEMQQDGKMTGRIGPFSYSELRSATVVHQHMKSLREKFDPNQDRAYVAPTGTLFVSESVLKGVLPQVLDEMLSTRAMLKKAAKYYKKHVPNLNPAILRQLEARQLALKYVANVTYGKFHTVTQYPPFTSVLTLYFA